MLVFFMVFFPHLYHGNLLMHVTTEFKRLCLRIRIEFLVDTVFSCSHPRRRDR
jgi:hypothetical protein